MLRKKYKKKNNDLLEDIVKAGTETCILKIQLKAVSKLEHHFIYEVSYLDQGELKTVPVFARNVTEILDILEPYVNKGLSEQATSFGIGSSEEIILSRKESSTFRPDEKTVFFPKSKSNERD